MHASVSSRGESALHGGCRCHRGGGFGCARSDASRRTCAAMGAMGVATTRPLMSLSGLIHTERPSVTPGQPCRCACMGMRVRVAGRGWRNGARPQCDAATMRHPTKPETKVDPKRPPSARSGSAPPMLLCVFVSVDVFVVVLFSLLCEFLPFYSSPAFSSGANSTRDAAAGARARAPFPPLTGGASCGSIT